LRLWGLAYRALRAVRRAQWLPAAAAVRAEGARPAVPLAGARTRRVAEEVLAACPDRTTLRAELSVVEVEACARAQRVVVVPAVLRVVPDNAGEARSRTRGVARLLPDCRACAAGHECCESTRQAQTANLERGPAGDTM